MKIRYDLMGVTTVSFVSSFFWNTVQK